MKIVVRKLLVYYDLFLCFCLKFVEKKTIKEIYTKHNELLDAFEKALQSWYQKTKKLIKGISKRIIIYNNNQQETVPNQ